MLVDIILDFVVEAIVWIVNQLPSMSIDLSLLADLGQYMGWVGQFVNVSALATCVGIVAAFEVAIGVVSLIVWLYEKIPLT